MKQMLKPFKPAEDRFAGVEVLRAEASGAAILPDAAAYLECRRALGGTCPSCDPAAALRVTTQSGIRHLP